MTVHDPLLRPPADLTSWVESAVGRVVGAHRIGSGASRLVWAVTVDDGVRERDVVLRVDTGTGPVAGTPLDLRREATVYAALAGSGLPVPRLLGVEPEGRALLLERAVGDESIGAAGEDQRAAVGRSYLVWLARLHELDPGALDLPGFALPADGRDHALADLDLWTAIHDDRAARWSSDATRFALAWLRANAPVVPSATSLCHGDAGPGNFLFAGDEVTALLDWEFAHVGDPHDDLAWVAVRNHLLGSPFSLPDVYGAWREERGVTVQPALLEYYRVFVLVRMAISCDATIAWRDGVEDDSIRTQVLLRPWLAAAIGTALRHAGCAGPEVEQIADAARAALESSPHFELLRLLPPLEPLEDVP